ncbi:MAG: uroporphyrinogen-III C-methyltransferase [Rhodanobacteraceae bacterium]
MSEEFPVTRTSTPRRARTGLAGLAMVLAIAALLLGGWAAWRAQRSDANDTAQAARLDARIANVERDDNANVEQQQAIDKRLRDAESGASALRDNLQGVDQRVRNLETALANLSDQHLSGRDALLLDDAEFLLRTGQQRYVLFHDADGALQAYALAGQALGQVEDPAFAPVRAGIASERAALAAAAPPTRQQALDALNSLRASMPTLPLAIPEVGTAATPQSDAWSRLWHAFGGILRVERVRNGPLPVADARFARELASLDLAQAQAALLDHDDEGYRAALQRVDAALVTHFDASAEPVQNARAILHGLLAARPLQPKPNLGGALAQLRDLRATHALQSIVPAPSSTSGVPQKR